MPPTALSPWAPGTVPAARVASRLPVVAVARCARRARRGLAAGRLLLGGLALAAAPRVARAVGGPGGAAVTDTLESGAAARVAEAVCDKRIVLLGELPEHGEARGFGVKARVVEHLVARCGFGAVLFEAGSYDFFGLERRIAAARSVSSGSAGAVASAAPADSLDLVLARAIGGLWWTRELAGWRQWLLRRAVSGGVVLGGLDDQPSATAAYARATLPGLVGAAAGPAREGECREAVARYLAWGYTAAQPYDSTTRARLADCARRAADRATAARESAARSPERRTPDEVMLDDAASYFARERGAAERGAAGAPDRDLVMARHLAWWSARLPRGAKIVVWTATTHAARAPGPLPALPLGVPPLGARAAERWGDQLAAIGFTALQGQSSRAGRPSQALAPLPPHALEARALASGPTGTAAWAYLDAPALRALGAVPSRLFGAATTADWSRAFDGVLVIRDEAAPTFEPRR